MELSNRILNMEASPIRKLYAIAREQEEKGKKIYYLNIGQPDIKTPKGFMEGIHEYKDEILSYCNSEGLPELIHSTIEYYKMHDMNFEEEEILVTNGGSEALLFTFIALCDVGDQILCAEPFYSNYNTFAEIAGAKILGVPTKIEENFQLPSMDVIEKLINPKVKAILVTHPSNPTGRIYSKEEMQMIAHLAKKHDLFIITDEVYREFIYDDLEYSSFGKVEGLEDRVVLIDSISKRYSACGARIGTIASKNKGLMKELLKLCQSRLAVSTINQIGAARLIRTPKEYFNEVLKEYEKRRDILYNALKNMDGVICPKPRGAFYLIAKLPVEETDDFIKWTLENFQIEGETILLSPAEGFYATEGMGKDEVRIAYVLEGESLKKAMNILKEALKAYRNK